MVKGEDEGVACWDEGVACWDEGVACWDEGVACCLKSVFWRGGGGHTVSLCGSGTNSRILSNKYLLLSNGSPGGGMIGGSSWGQGFQPRWSLVRRERVFSSESQCTLTLAVPGVCQGGARTLSSPPWKYPVQSNWLTMMVPSSIPISWAWLVWADWSTTRTRSSRHPTSVFLNFCFSRPKHQSGANFVWPTSKNDISILLLSPHITRQAKYCMTNLI